MQKYFSKGTSIRAWIGVKYWRDGQKVWWCWADKRPRRVGGRLHTAMQWPPNHSSIHQPTNIIYSIPITTVLGLQNSIPASFAMTLDINTDDIPDEILQYV